MKHSHGHHVHYAYRMRAISTRDRVLAMALVPLIVITIGIVMSSFQVRPAGSVGVVSLGTLLVATFYTMMRVAIAYLLSALVSVPLAILTVSNRTLEAFLLPILDVLESIPILAVFPVIIVFFVSLNFLEGAAIFILFSNMLWGIVFAVIGGLKIIPKDISLAAQTFGIRGFSYVRKVMLPAIFPQFITGSIIAVADAWNLIIVAEALHTYIPGGTPSQDLFGIGSILVASAASSQTHTFLLAVTVMVVAIALFNVLVWQKLLHYSQRFRFE